jgi:hypothetical protein
LLHLQWGEEGVGEIAIYIRDTGEEEGYRVFTRCAMRGGMSVCKDGRKRIVMTHRRRLFGGCYVVGWDVIGIAHSEESVDRAVLVPTHGVDNGVPIQEKTRRSLR